MLLPCCFGKGLRNEAEEPPPSKDAWTTATGIHLMFCFNGIDVLEMNSKAAPYVAPLTCHISLHFITSHCISLDLVTFNFIHLVTSHCIWLHLTFYISLHLTASHYIWLHLTFYISLHLTASHYIWLHLTFYISLHLTASH